MFESLKSAAPFTQGLFVMIAGIVVVFLSLIAFFVLIKVLQNLYPNETSEPLLRRLFGKRN